MEESKWQDEFVKNARNFINDQLDKNEDIDKSIDNVSNDNKIKEIFKIIKSIEEIKRKMNK